MNDYIRKWCCLIIFDHEQNNTDALISMTSSIDCTKYLYYEKEINIDDKWNVNQFEKQLQKGEDSGIRMRNAFEHAFAKGFRKVVLIKNNFDQMQTEQIAEAFNCLKMIEFCIGPKSNGDYYLLGMNYFEPSLFQNKQWDAATFLKATINDIGKLKLALYKLKLLN